MFGLVSAGQGCSFWPYWVIRAEGAAVRIGRGCDIQDGAVIHVGGGRGTAIARFLFIAPRRGARRGGGRRLSCRHWRGGHGRRESWATLRDWRHGAGAAWMEVPDRAVVMGVPGKVVTTRDNFVATRRNALI